jgi:predicted N-formylglutamate amidohydrolase
VARRAARWLLTCEHASRDVPDEFREAFARAGAVMDSHRAWDPGALGVFSALAPDHADHASRGRATRLLVDLNRSLHHPRLFSEFTRRLPREVRDRIVDHWWRPFRDEAESVVAAWRADGLPVVHLSVHSFTPVLDGHARTADIGLLYDPRRAAELGLARRCRDLLADRGWSVRLNYPYRGVADGHTTAMRRRHPEGFAGFELEINQRLFEDAAVERALIVDLDATLAALRRSGI